MGSEGLNTLLLVLLAVVVLYAAFYALQWLMRRISSTRDDAMGIERHRDTHHGGHPS